MNVDEVLAYIFSNPKTWVSVKQSIDNAIPVQYFRVNQPGGKTIRRSMLEVNNPVENLMSESQFRVMFRGTTWEKVGPMGSSKSYLDVEAQS
jgi:hypothetical protein